MRRLEVQRPQAITLNQCSTCRSPLGTPFRFVALTGLLCFHNHGGDRNDTTTQQQKPVGDIKHDSKTTNDNETQNGKSRTQRDVTHISSDKLWTGSCGQLVLPSQKQPQQHQKLQQQ